MQTLDKRCQKNIKYDTKSGFSELLFHQFPYFTIKNHK